MNRIRRTIYVIRGKVALKDLKKVPEKVRIKAYVIGDRVVLGSAPVGKNGSFTVKYEHRVFAKRDLPLGVHLVIGPDIPEQGILRTKFPRIPIKPKVFKKTKSTNPHSLPVYEYMMQKELHLDVARVADWYRRFFYEWRPCVEVKACDSLLAPGEPGAGEEDLNLPNVHVRVSKVYERFFPPPQYYSACIAEGPVDDDGYFRASVVISLLFFPIGWYRGDRVEVFQVFPDRTVTLHEDEIPLGLRSGARALENDICQKVGVLKSDVEYPIETGVPGPGSTFYFERVGKVPVGYIDSATGRADTSTVPATVAGTLRGLYDVAFGGKIKFFADIGVGLVETVKYFRIKYSYEPEDGVAPLVGYIQVPFNPPRWGKEGEPAVVNEFMGPIDASGTYIYPNSYEMMFLPPEEVKDWYFNGLIMELNTGTLPMSFKKYTFTLEPLDAGKNAVTVEPGTEDLLQLTLLVDNEMPEGEIGDILDPLGSAVPACGILRLTPAGTRTSCDQLRDRVTGEITVHFKARDNNGNLGSLEAWAYYGEYPTCPEDAPHVLVGPGVDPQYMGPGGVPLTGFQNYSDFILANPTERPLWHGRENYLAVRPGNWDVCAHQIRLRVYKRVTNGENPCIIHPEYTKHITIMQT